MDFPHFSGVTNPFTGVFYIRDFISTDGEKNLMDKVYSVPKPKWTNLSNRRLQNWGGIVGKRTLIPDDGIPEWLNQMVDRIMELKVFPERNRPNHVLINEYQPGQGIMPHTDGPVFYPIIATLSMGSHTFLNLYRHVKDEAHERNELLGSLYLEPRSLVLITGAAYQLLHGIESKKYDMFDSKVLNSPSCISQGDVLHRNTRVSLTIRNIPIVAHSVFQLVGK